MFLLRIKTILVALIICCSETVQSQNFDFSFSTSTESYSPLITYSLSQSETTDNGESKHVISIGFDLNFLDKDFNDVYVTPNGVLSFGNDNHYCFSAMENLIIDIDSASHSEVRYKTVGTQGDRICKIEFSNFLMEGSEIDQHLSFQVWLIEQNHSIELHYGENDIDFSMVSGKPVIGPTNRQQDSSPWAYYLNGDPSNPSPILMEDPFASSELNEIPTEGTIYRFQPN